MTNQKLSALSSAKFPFNQHFKIGGFCWIFSYFNSVSRFMPRVEIVQKHNTAARRLYIRGHNGKIYPYLVMNDACLTESRREERVLQLLRLLNPCLEKRKETTKRHLFFTGAIYWRGGYLGFTRLFVTDPFSHVSSGLTQTVALSVHLPCIMVSISFWVQFPLLSFPRGLHPPRCLPALLLCIDWLV